MSEAIQVPEAISKQLRMAMIDAGDLVTAVQKADLVSIADPPGGYHCKPTLAVPRPLDPETAEMRQLDVYLKPTEEGGLEVFAVRGLDLEELET